MLASASKARHGLLEKAAIPHCLMASGIDEERFQGSDALKMVEMLAIAKANAVASKLASKAQQIFPYKKITSILGCDSVFLFENEIYGKPRDANEAIERWERMSSNSGFLITGHALLFGSSAFNCQTEIPFNRALQKVISTRVEFVDLSHAQIEKYVSTGEPLECAGGFALEGKGAMLISSICGCYSNVIGLSLPWLRKAFLKAGLE
ncbi:nucleoside triphosphate pyrophosphatase [Prochlorococcus sp. MIT 1307]|uniref:Maf family protein n=1 Tax=Prochlorococcus sp. MIT 1307 TaxID=3096219 RepID=UPI002A74E32C|nr:nucleoside triphosphate pyrophosphatase [Prochlorococcus sp. MIT 1307]